MKVLGLTGGVGMGKSTCSGLLRARGIPVVDTDELAHRLVEPGQPALEVIQKIFGPEILDQHGHLLRGELARRVFANDRLRAQLEHILHPRIRQLWRAQVDAWRSEGRPLAAVVIPLLFETGAEKELDATITVACSAPTQLARLKPRGWSSEQIQQRVQAQLPIEQKLARADFVIWNEADLEVHAAQLDRILLTFSDAFARASARFLHHGPDPGTTIEPC